MKRIFLPIILILLNVDLSAQSQEITVETIYSGTFRTQQVTGINWMNDGQFYSTLVHNSDYDLVVKYNVLTGEAVDTLVDGRNIEGNVRFSEYQLSQDESKALLLSNFESIYRRSFLADYYLYDITENNGQRAIEEKVSYATFSPDGQRIAYTYKNDLYFLNLEDQKTTRITSDGKFNEIINGSCDWVYEEEFSFVKAFFWSPDSRKIAYYTFDEKEVKRYNMQLWGDLYPMDYQFKYPKAGEKNSIVHISVYDLDKASITKMDIGSETDIYIPRIQWTNDPDLLAVIRMNRLQNKMELIHFGAKTGEPDIILTEESESYVDIEFNDQFFYLEDGESFITTSEKDGFKHIYQYAMDGKEIRQITQGEWEASGIVILNEKKKEIFFSSTEDSPLERQLYRIDFSGKRKTKITNESGWYSIDISPDYKYMIEEFNSIAQPPRFTVKKTDGKSVRVLEDNQKLQETLTDYTIGKKELITVDLEGRSLNGYMIKPSDFDPQKKYPLLMYLYGGPGSQRVSNRWQGNNDYWHFMLAEKGYLVVCIDNRGTGGRGRDFKHVTYGKLGKYEVEDQLDVARYFQSLPYIDADRMGIWGWSYGGYMSSLATFIGNDIFKMGIAVAPVSNWKYYDTVYTERYLMRPQDNPEGYEEYSPVNHAHKLDSKYLLIHGTGDDNVHVQNSIELANELIKQNKSFDQFYYPNRNHGIYGGNTRVHLFNLLTRFVEENL